MNAATPTVPSANSAKDILKFALIILIASNILFILNFTNYNYNYNFYLILYNNNYTFLAPFCLSNWLLIHKFRRVLHQHDRTMRLDQVTFL